MKGRLLAVAGVVFLVLFLLNLATLFYFRRQYNEDINAVSQDSWVLKVKADAIEKEMAAWKEGATEASAKVKVEGQKIAELEEALSRATAKIDTMDKKITALNAASEVLQSRFDSMIEVIAEIKEGVSRVSAGAKGDKTP